MILNRRSSHFSKKVFLFEIIGTRARKRHNVVAWDAVPLTALV